MLRPAGHPRTAERRRRRLCSRRHHHCSKNACPPRSGSRTCEKREKTRSASGGQTNTTPRWTQRVAPPAMTIFWALATIRLERRQRPEAQDPQSPRDNASVEDAHFSHWKSANPKKCLPSSNSLGKARLEDVGPSLIAKHSSPINPTICYKLGLWGVTCCY